MARTLQPQELIDSAVVDPNGNKIGKVGNVYLADATHQPEWITVKTGMFGTKESFVPLSGAHTDQDGVHVQVDKDSVSGAPRIDADGHLSPEESTQLYQHYGLPVPRTSPDGRMDRGKAGTGKRDDRAMTRSEERLNVGTEQVETGRVRLRKYVVTEEQQVTVPVRHEEVRIEREPITRADGTAEIGEAEQDVVLHAEKPVVRKETVPVERARLRTETVSDEQTVSGKVRKEQFEVTDDDRKHRRS
ncbi:DUF2382 domain-containing protein [Amycolatopsis sp. lyj-23]|uniref:DUF2382 domain-containing protein n=1 Tax=Amycolatopsis sp. lyj-23 TaxID=2789283 RepID=UPI00397ABF1B